MYGCGGAPESIEFLETYGRKEVADENCVVAQWPAGFDCCPLLGTAARAGNAGRPGKR